MIAKLCGKARKLTESEERLAMEYDPAISPDPEEWLEEDDAEKVVAILEYHRAAGIRLPDEHLHATVHAIVENQIAMSDLVEPRAALKRLMQQGLSRHDAVHAIANEMIFYLLDVSKNNREPDNELYFNALRELTAEKWLQSDLSEDEEEDI